MNQSGIGAIVTDRRLNAAASWLLVTFLVVAVAASLLAGDLLRAAFAATLATLSAVPAVAYGDPRVTLPWEVLVVAALPVIGQSFATVQLTSDLATYLSVAAVALVVAVELHTFTTVRMSSGFAVLFVVVATMATAGVWAVVRWLADQWLQTTYLVDPLLSEAEIHAGLMWEFTFSTVAGVVAGVVFEGYFRRHARVQARAAVAAEGSDGNAPATPGGAAGDAAVDGRTAESDGSEDADLEAGDGTRASGGRQ